MSGRNFGDRALIAAEWTAVGLVTTKLLSWLVTLVLAQVLHPSGFGALALGWILYGASLLIRDQAVTGILVFGPDRPETRHATFWLSILASVFLGLVLIAASPMISKWTGVPSLGLTIGLAFALLGSSLGTTASGILQRELRFAVLTLSDVVATGVFAVTALASTAMGGGVTAVGIAQLVGAATGSAIVLWNSGYRPAFVVSVHLGRALSFYGASLFALSVAAFLFSNLDTLAVAIAIGGPEVGRYSLAFNIACVGSVGFATLLNRVAFPAFTLRAHSVMSLAPLYQRSLSFIATLAFPIAIIIAWIVPPLVEPLFGPDYAIEPSVIRVLAIYGASLTLAAPGVSLLKALGRPEVMVRTFGAQILLAVLLLLWLVPLHGSLGAATGVTIPLMLGTFAIAVVSARSVGVNTRDSLRAFKTAAISAPGLLIPMIPGAALGGTSGLVAGGVVGLTTYFWIAQSRDEDLKSLKRRALKGLRRLDAH